MVEIQPEPRIAVIIRSSAWLGIVAHTGFIPLFWLTGYPVSLEGCLKEADDALYRGKAEGRNRVVTAQGLLN